MDQRRLLFVHAHPDDEVIGTGATMIDYARRGIAVALVTGTRGDLFAGPGGGDLGDWPLGGGG
jgi:LmbE family N-acetylglucosaminyl deacetylase